MENILNKNIFDDSDLDKLSPDYKPDDLVLRMQMRRTMVKDTHNHGAVRSTAWTRLKSVVFNNEILIDDGMNANESDKDIFLPDLYDDGKELELRNDDEFKLNTKTKPVKHIKFCKEIKYKKSKQSKGELLDLNKDINENNEDIFRVACVHKFSNPEPSPANLSVEEKEQLIKNSYVSPNNTDRPVGDLQELLVMMAISTKPSNNDEIYEVVECSGELTTNHYYLDNNVDDNSLTTNTPNHEGIDNILSITPLRVQINEREKYLMEKVINRWRQYVNNRKKHVDEQRQTTLKNFFDKIAKKKMDMKQLDEYEQKAKQQLRDYNTYQHRYKVQKHIIALQKAKLEEQNRLIEELKYNKIIEASRQSVDAMREEVRRTYYEIDRQLKPKLKCMTNELKIPELEEQSLVLHCLKVPQFLQRMEKRAREREEKHAMIRERRLQMEEERIRIKQQAELAKAEMDKEEKMRRMKELKEKRKRERIENIRKKQWTERLRALIVMADLHYEKTLMNKYGIAPLRKLVAMKRDNIEKARAHYRFQLKNNVFLHWMWYTEDMWFERNFRAEDFYRKTLLRKVFAGFRMIHNSVAIKKQVADDYYDLYVTQLGFRMWREGIQVIRKENELKLQKAVLYHESNLLFKAFTCWRTLPALNALKREQEARKARWREKVLQVVPDYTPPDE
ncbi:uncharacterized protein LOC142975255 [Anticarsia gemmatalis]|uniref:uncharacterized protein LOC142975255 n=1 Tax=Anticarsia gemmatalis TaxID=129554 RepID=UPI003F77548C